MGAALLIMAFITLLCFVVIYKLVKSRQASHWPSVEGVILKSHSQGANTAKTVARIEYQFEVGGVTYHSKQIRAGDRFGMAAGPEVLDRFPKGATVPVYYNPKAPGESVLVTQLPYSVPGAWAGAGALFMAGVGAALAFTNLDAEMEYLRSIFPKGAEPQGTIFFGLCASWILFMIWDNWRHAARAKGWPTAEGTVVTSEAQGYKAKASSGSQGPHVTLYEPAIRYRYSAQGREYHSSQVAFGARVSTKSEEVAAKRAARYPEGGTVTVHYDPEHPTVAVLETGVAFQGVTIFLAAVCVGLAIFFAGVRP